MLQTIAGLSARHGGPSYSVPRLSTALAQAGLSTTLICVGEAKAPAARRHHAGYSELRLGWDFASVPVLGALRWSGGFRRAVYEGARQADVVHDHGLWLMPNLWAARAALAAGTPLVLSPRGMLSAAALHFSPRKKWLMWHLAQGAALRRAQCLHATSAAEYEDIRSRGLANPVAVIPNGIDLPDLAPDRRAQAARYVLFLGRLHPKKGLDTLIRAWSVLEPSQADWQLRIIGPSERGYGKELAALAARLGCSRLSIEGEVAGAAKWQIYRNASLFVLPTRNENFGLTVAEALAARVPVIATKGAPWPGLVREACGWWIDEDWSCMAHTMAQAMALDDTERQAMGARGRAWMARDFAWSGIGQQMARVYEWLCTGANRPPCVHLD